MFARKKISLGKVEGSFGFEKNSVEYEYASRVV